MTDFVLVHGAWHGGWCWRRVSSNLLAAGHRTFTPSLTGSGDRCQELAPDNNLTLHVNDIVSLIRTEGLDRFILCGHSDGGMVVRRVAEIAPPSALVYLDAYVPKDGQSGLDLRSPEANSKLRQSVQEGWRVPPPKAADFGVEDEADLNWVDSMLSPMSLGCFKERIALSDLPLSLPTFYLRTAWPNASLDGFYQQGLRAGWEVEQWSGGHEMMIDKSQETSAYLLKIAQRVPGES